MRHKLHSNAARKPKGGSDNRMDKSRLIENTYLFRGITAADLSALSAVAEQTTLFPGQLVYDVEQHSDALFIIEVGTVDIIVKGKQTPVVTMGSGQTLGELAFFQPAPRFATATARERTELVRISFDKLGRLLEERPAFALVFYRNACAFLAKHVRELGAERDRRYF
jgi:CRP/FNR family cyclic AMP-dependent transcriptional regulator